MLYLKGLLLCISIGIISAVSSFVCKSPCLLAAPLQSGEFVECLRKDFGHGSSVCVCNEDRCDTVEPLEPMGDNEAVVYTTGKSGDRLRRSTLNFTKASRQSGQGSIVISLQMEKEMQEIVGFGGAFTDAAGINIASLSPLMQQQLLNSYYAPTGIEYTMGRIPMASCDFSTRLYSYDDVDGDFNLSEFQLAQEDYNLKIPYIKYAQSIAQIPIKLFASPWSAPGWMKNSGKMYGNGTLIGKPGSKYYKTWAQYFAKFVEEYAKRNITIWAVTMQNEPTTGFIYQYPFQTMGFSPPMQRDFLKMDLGPALAGLNVKIMILDDNRLMLPKWADVVLNDSEARKFVSFIAVHWYLDELTPSLTLQATHDRHPDVPMIGTEACEGWKVTESRGPVLGSWLRAKNYIRSIMEDLNNWFVGWVDWNLALDLQGGPNWVRNFVDSPIIVDTTNNVFYKQPTYYVLGHFSKFLPPGSKRIAHTANLTGRHSLPQIVAFKRKDGLIVLIVHNEMEEPLPVTVPLPHSNMLYFSVPASSIQTVLWKQDGKIS
ncbi:glucosylceramidase [Trichuris trichiura]|uniref:Glucosylceramidase n=1 Tax=Trichuris trichiura TaxID=36087 RepID=A0A077Z084_TRITR|nr:glucosylceramidase [Trichuris trichiura]